MNNILLPLEQLLKPLGVGSYYMAYYAGIFVGALVFISIFLLLRNHLRPFVKNALIVLLTIMVMRIIFLDNPLAWIAYSKMLTQKEIGYRQYGVILLQAEKYKRSFSPDNIDYLAVGSSQVGAIFHHWRGHDEQVRVFSVAGMKPIDFMLYRNQIIALRPRSILLYLSEFDIANTPQLEETISIGPSQGLYVFELYTKMKRYPLWKDYQNILLRAFAGEVFPEYKYSFVFRGLLNKLIVPAAEAVGEKVQPIADDHELRKQVEQFTQSLNEEVIGFNMSFLEDFIKLCRRRKIDVIILEGQYNPLAYSEKTLKLNNIVRLRLRQLENIYDNVRFMPRSELYEFHKEDYRDISHAVPEAAQVFTRHLSDQLAQAKRSASNSDETQSTCRFRLTKGWHEYENDSTGWLRWTGGRGEMIVLVPKPADIDMTGEIISMHGEDKVNILLNKKKVNTWAIKRDKWEFKKFEPLSLRLKEGKNIIEVVSEKGSVTQGKDPRPLAVALKNLRVTAANNACELTR